MKQNNRLTGRRIGAAAVLATVTICSGLALAPAAFADSTAASATTSGPAHNVTVHPDTGANCTAMLLAFGYPVTVSRALICYVAASPIGNQGARFVACANAMIATGVGGIAASAACTEAVASG